MAVMKTLLKVIVGLLVVFLVGGTILKSYFEKEKEAKCLALEKESAALLPHLVTSDLLLRNSSVTGRIKNESKSDIHGEAIFEVVVSDCVGSTCTVVGRDNFFARYLSIPPSEARDVVAIAARNELSRISPQGRLQYSIRLVTVNWGRDGCYF